MFTTNWSVDVLTHLYITINYLCLKHFILFYESYITAGINYFVLMTYIIGIILICHANIGVFV